MIIDANNLILGRMATVVAKKALLGENIEIVNCEKSVVSGDPSSIVERYQTRARRGIPAKGPFIPKRADAFVKRAIRGMLPYKNERGSNALKRVRCYIGIPDNLKDKKMDTIKEADMKKLPNLMYLSVEKICKSIGTIRRK